MAPWLAIGVLALLLSVSVLYNFKISSQPQSAESKDMQAFVNDMEQRRYRYPVIDVKEERVYLPESRMYLPLNEWTRDLRYQVIGKKVWLSSAIAVGRQTGDADASCDRVVILSDTDQPNDGGYIEAGTIRTPDGSTLYISRHDTCQIYSDILSKNLAEVAQKIQYY